MEKRRAVGALCNLQRAREEKPLLLLEMASCTNALLREHSGLTESISLAAGNGSRAMLLKKLAQLQTFMQKLWDVFSSHLPDLPPLGARIDEHPLPEVDDDGELVEVKQCGTADEVQLVEEEEEVEIEESEDSDADYESE